MPGKRLHALIYRTAELKYASASHPPEGECLLALQQTCCKHISVCRQKLSNATSVDALQVDSRKSKPSQQVQAGSAEIPPTARLAVDMKPSLHGPSRQQPTTTDVPTTTSLQPVATANSSASCLNINTVVHQAGVDPLLHLQQVACSPSPFAPTSFIQDDQTTEVLERKNTRRLSVAIPGSAPETVSQATAHFEDRLPQTDATSRCSCRAILEAVTIT
jgi:hypothetical protein